MLKTRYILTNGLKKLEKLEKFNKYEGTKQKLNIYHRDINNYDDKKNKKSNKMSKMEINNIALIRNFPNALLLEESIFNGSKHKKKEIIIKKIPEKPQDIWDILNKMKKENNSESLDMLTTENSTENDETNNTHLITKICKGCNTKGSFIEDQQSSAIVCSECGMINEELLDHGPEWRQYNNDDNRGEGMNRCGCPLNFFFPKSSQGTIMTGSSNSQTQKENKNGILWFIKKEVLTKCSNIFHKVCLKIIFLKLLLTLQKYFIKK